MADLGSIETELNGMPDTGKNILVRIFRALVPFLVAGPVEHQRKLTNFARYYVTSTTSSVANTEFSIVHGMGRAPHTIRPVLPMDAVGAKVVRLTNTRVADAMRVYLSSPDTSAVVSVELE